MYVYMYTVFRKNKLDRSQKTIKWPIPYFHAKEHASISFDPDPIADQTKE